MQVHPNLWLGFLYGFIGGTLLAGIYNLLVVHELHLFGLEVTRIEASGRDLIGPRNRRVLSR